jgi:signal transduction histidine kinase
MDPQDSATPSLSPQRASPHGALCESDEIEIVSVPALSPKQRVITDLHSVINLVGVLFGCLELLQGESVDGLEGVKQQVMQLTDEINSAAEEGRVFPLDPELPKAMAADIDAAIRRTPDHANDESLDELRSTIAAVFEVFEVRVAELNARLADPKAWIPFSTAQLSSSIQQVLDAIEKNALGRYRIVRNIAEQTSSDYQIEINISTEDGDQFLMPPVLQDVLRDIIANARKYTPLGGRISAGLFSSAKGLRVVVEDNGFGIPKEELHEVINFGYRASNVLDRRTLGGGFGLTKALCVVKDFGGRMWIRSRVDVGTRITLFIPNEEGSQH